MSRWEPGAPERLQQAALDLFATRGFEQTTAAEIAQSVGLTERTFFRHFSDKREVLFHGQELLVQAFLDGLDGAPAGATALEMVAMAMDVAATSFFPDERRPYSRTRQAVIEENPALQERELRKLAHLATVIAAALRERGVEEPAATLAAESGRTVFAIAFGQWVREGEERSLAEIQADVMGRLLSMGEASSARSAQGVERRPISR
jgi:AcrR family transcriptional regulator